MTALDNISQSIGNFRIIPGTGVLHVAGDPRLTPEEEHAWRRRLVERALRALQTDVNTSRVFAAESA
jgi:glycine reductase